MIAVDNAQGGGFLALYPAGAPGPLASSINFVTQPRRSRAEDGDRLTQEGQPQPPCAYLQGASHGPTSLHQPGNPPTEPRRRP